MNPNLPAWPDCLFELQPLNESYAVKLPDPYARDDFEQGLARQTRVFRNAPATFQCTWPMDPKQYEIFLGWLDAIGGQNCWFNLAVFRGGSYEVMSVRIVKGSMGQPVQRQGGKWMVSAQIETMDFKPMDANATVAAMLTYGSDLSLDDLVAQLSAGWATLVSALR